MPKFNVVLVLTEQSMVEVEAPTHEAAKMLASRYVVGNCGDRWRDSEISSRMIPEFSGECDVVDSNGGL